MGHKSKNVTCQNCKQDFIIEPDDFGFYERMGVPSPILCQECRQEHRILFRNFKTLYKRKSDKSDTPLISMYDDNALFPVWTHEEWWSDDWDGADYGRDLDLDRPFFEQLFDIWKEVPHYGLQNVSSENCEYSNMAWGSKNCYLVFGCIENENCNYGHILWDSTDSADGLYLYKCELCFECVDCINCNKVLYSQDCENCADSIGLFNCNNCVSCIGCVNLQNKNNCIFNKQVSKEEYDKFLKDNPLSDPASIKKIIEEREKLRLTLPHRYYFGTHNAGASGNHVYNSKNVHYSFDIKSGENSKFGYTLRTFKNSYDVSFNPDIEESYQTLACGKSTNLISCHLCNSSSYAYYSEHCYNSHNIFGCQGLKSAEYCILNKQYSKEDYLALKEKIVTHMKSTGEWGKWFPLFMSPFAYNESIVNEYSPKTKDEAIKQGYKWQDNIPATRGQETIKHADLPKDPQSYDETLLDQILKCDSCSRNYRLTKNEILFYQKLNLALPRLCFNCRHQARMDLRLPRRLWHRQCMCELTTHDHTDRCPNESETSYAPERPEVVYCEGCYQREVY
jgi:hypothetical protein